MNSSGQKMESSLISTEGVLGASFIIMSANMMENDVNGGGDDGEVMMKVVVVVVMGMMVMMVC